MLYSLQSEKGVAPAKKKKEKKKKEKKKKEITPAPTPALTSTAHIQPEPAQSQPAPSVSPQPLPQHDLHGRKGLTDGMGPGEPQAASPSPPQAQPAPVQQSQHLLLVWRPIQITLFLMLYLLCLTFSGVEWGAAAAAAAAVPANPNHVHCELWVLWKPSDRRDVLPVCP